jgi:hypothetical protein
MRDFRRRYHPPERPSKITRLASVVPLDLRIIEVSTAAGRTIVAAQVLAGDPRVGQHLVVEGTGQRWDVRGVAFVPPEAVEAGRWGLTLAPVGHEEPLRAESRLRAAEAW